jgi:hypothetical protein
MAATMRGISRRTRGSSTGFPGRGSSTATRRQAEKLTKSDAGRPRIDIINDVLDNGIWGDDGGLHNIEGMILDAFTASMLKQVHDALSPENQSVDSFDHEAGRVEAVKPRRRTAADTSVAKTIIGWQHGVDEHRRRDNIATDRGVMFRIGAGNPFRKAIIT